MEHGQAVLAKQTQRSASCAVLMGSMIEALSGCNAAELTLSCCLPALFPFALPAFGATASVWYDLAYIEARQGVGKHQRVWQLAFGRCVKAARCNLHPG